MRKHHPAVHSAKETFLIHLSYILTDLNKQVTQREIAKLCQVSYSTLNAVKNGHGKNVSLETMLRIADAIRLSYTLTLTSRLGKPRYTVVAESGYQYMKSPHRINIGSRTGLSLGKR